MAEKTAAAAESPRTKGKSEVAVAEPPPREHIFPATRLTAVCLRWKDLTRQALEFSAKGKPEEAAAKHGEAFQLLEQIIIESTPMFERLAQYEGYHHTVSLEILVQAAREKVPRWLLACDVKRLGEGKLFSWFSTCSKNAFRSEVAKQRQHTNRFHATSDSLEKFVGSVDHAVDMHDMEADAGRRIKEIAVRWGDPQELGAVRYMVECIVDQDRYQGEDVARSPNKDAIVRGASFAYGISPELAKFFYQWGLFALRDALLDKRRVPFTKQDILRNRESYSFLPDVIDIVGWDRFSDLVMKLGGQRIKLPTVAQLARMHEDHLLRDELDGTDLTPEGFEGVARKRGRSPRAASDLFAEMAEQVGAHRTGEHPLYSEDQT